MIARSFRSLFSGLSWRSKRAWPSRSSVRSLLALLPGESLRAGLSRLAFRPCWTWRAAWTRSTGWSFRREHVPYLNGSFSASNSSLWIGTHRSGWSLRSSLSHRSRRSGLARWPWRTWWSLLARASVRSAFSRLAMRSLWTRRSWWACHCGTVKAPLLLVRTDAWQTVGSVLTVGTRASVVA